MKLFKSLLFLTAVIMMFVLIQEVTEAGGNSQKDGYTLRDTTLKIIWREDIYDKGLKAPVSVIKLNEEYFSNISDPEKAVIGYLASTIGNECYSDGGKQNVKCKILAALNMGYQCSESNKKFFRNWFRDEADILKQVENCKPNLPSATVEKTFDEVKITTHGDEITVNLKGLKLNILENSASSWSEVLEFKLTNDKLALVERSKKS